jgi:hypothetical protein
VNQLIASRIAMPAKMNAVRRMIAPMMPSTSTRWRSSSGIAKNEKRIAKTNRLSSDSDFSIRKPDR